ncbi:25S rRNA (adenine645-N1)-methyltransferase [Mortierella polycephala]|uniref:Ribosomal RNA-processing protein 8 n=1 Tax=Mortierella polycephala TaxID=41804 RepID=A0A9P6PWX3_9FUNG|nr:25S rRNA (adenine645-N1)-methyltransferase [Mortierella polycephala]
MFAIPGFSVGNLVVEAPKEQLKKRKHDAVTTASSSSTSTSTLTAATKTTSATTTTATSSSSSSSSSSSAAAVLSIAKSTSNAPFSKKFKKEPVFEKRPPSEPKLGWGWIPEPVPLKERESWNRSTKELRKAKAKAQEEERAKKIKAMEDEKKRLVSSISGPTTAVELLLQGSVDMTDIAALGSKKNKKNDKGGDQDVEMTEAAESTAVSTATKDSQEQEPKKRNKRLERKIKRAAYIAAVEAKEKGQTDKDSEPTAQIEVANEGQDETLEDGEKANKKKKATPVAAPVNPELAKLTNKEKRMLKQLQKKHKEEGVDLTTKAPTQQPQKQQDQKQKQKPKQDKAAPTAEEPAKSKKDMKAQKKAAEEKSKNKDEKKSKTENSDTSKKQQQLAKEREKLMEALSRTNNALEELQKSLGEGEDEAPLAKSDVKSAVEGKKKKNKKDSTLAPTEKKELAKTASALASTPAATQQKQPKLTKLQEHMKKTLAGGKFRFLNEQLYTTTGEEAFGLFQSKPELFDEYHEGFRSQVESWPQNPVDIFIAQLKQMPKSTVIADLGCGDAQIAAELLPLKYKVMSFDLVAKNDRVTACDIANLPLEDASVDVAIFCLSLMGTDFLKFLREAYRVLKPNGKLKISEVISRFTDVDAFVEALKTLGFELKDSDSSNKMFIMFDFVKPDPNLANSSSKKNKKGSKKQKVQEDPADVDIDALDGPSLLKPCIYKKR